MSAQNPTSMSEWWANLPIPWLVTGPNGVQEAAANGAIVDNQIALIKLATKAHFPDYAPPDALPHIGGDRQLEQGPSETNANFIIRLKTAWDDWARAGTALEMLVQLYWGGFTGATIVQQNGLMYSLSGAPTAGQDPTSLLVIANADANPSLGGIPWWTFDANTAFASRFAVLFSGTGGAFTTSATATFTGTEDGSTANPWPVVTWNNAFVDTTYKIQVGATYSNDPVMVSADTTTQTTTGVGLVASGSFTGSVDVLAYQAGANPFVDLHASDQARLARLINRWRPAKATCAGVTFVLRSPVWGFGMVWGSFTWGRGSSVHFGV